MKNQQWQLGPETEIVSRNKKEERQQGKLDLANKAVGKPSSKKKLGKQIEAGEKQRCNYSAAQLPGGGEAPTNQPSLYKLIFHFEQVGDKRQVP